MSPKTHVWIVIFAALALMFAYACGDDADPAPVDGDSEGSLDGDLSDGDESEAEQTIDGDQEEQPQAETYEGTVLINKGSGMVLTPSARMDDGTFGDAESWKAVPDYGSARAITNFAYTHEGIILGYSPLSRQVRITTYPTQMLANNGALQQSLEGPYNSLTAYPVDEGDFIYMFLEDQDVTYYLRIEYKVKISGNLSGYFWLSTDPTFP